MVDQEDKLALWSYCCAQLDTDDIADVRRLYAMLLSKPASIARARAWQADQGSEEGMVIAEGVVRMLKDIQHVSGLQKSTWLTHVSTKGLKDEDRQLLWRYAVTEATGVSDDRAARVDIATTDFEAMLAHDVKKSVKKAQALSKDGKLVSSEASDSVLRSVPVDALGYILGNESTLMLYAIAQAGGQSASPEEAVRQLATLQTQDDSQDVARVSLALGRLTDLIGSPVFYHTQARVNKTQIQQR